MSQRYKIWNGPMPTTAAFASVSTGTAIKTMLQIATPVGRGVDVISWGFSSDDPPGADAVIELIQTDVAATVTAHVASGVQPLDSNMPASALTLGTTATGYTASGEGVVTATRVLDVVALSSVSGESPLSYSYQFTAAERWNIPVSKFLRVRATTPTTAIDLRCWVVVAE